MAECIKKLIRFYIVLKYFTQSVNNFFHESVSWSVVDISTSLNIVFTRSCHKNKYAINFIHFVHKFY